PCHVPARDMRLKPVGTGPFKFVEFKPNESIKVTKNTDYWKKDRPYLDGIEYTFIANPSTAILAFASGNFDRFAQGILSLPLMKELKSHAPEAVCEVVSWNIPRQMLVNRDKPPFDSPDLRRAMALTLDRKAFIDIISDGEGSVGGAMMPPPAGTWGMPLEVLHSLPGYGPDVQKNRAEAREIMKKLGYGPDKRLPVTLTTRNVPAYRDPSVLLIDQLKEIYIDGTLNAIDTTQWYPTVMRKDYAVGLTVSENGLDDPDQQFYENFVCGAERNYTGYCSKEVDELVERQSAEADVAKRKKIVWEIEKKLAEDGARPAIFYPVSAACWQPYFRAGFSSLCPACGPAGAASWAMAVFERASRCCRQGCARGWRRQISRPPLCQTGARGEGLCSTRPPRRRFPARRDASGLRAAHDRGPPIARSRRRAA
ncbi:MAG: hypothetical protein E6G69_02195, partial [Alphaproteobacteria bacterium]